MKQYYTADGTPVPEDHILRVIPARFRDDAGRYYIQARIPALGYVSPILVLSATTDEDADLEAMWHFQSLTEKLAEEFGMDPQADVRYE